MSNATCMSDTARIDSYAKVKGWDPSMLPKAPPLMTRSQFRRFMKKLRRKMQDLNADAASEPC